ncbi:helix-turn-helix domain-containing protein [Jiangella asiatica]|uniref:DNA-binding protein n=1 Tax=Jiangella asiatica TaxID=2530372 RepID=A0A4R5CUV0_9ACTN|nr:helix-turn-helix domain-containing protein [Jiangella asiatica]TDE03427.1 DNA-binding protein [Jiangella asiatica]
MAGPLTTAEVADRLGKSKKTISQHAKRGHIPGAFQPFGKDWRFDRDQFEAWLDAQKAGDPWRAPKGARR